MSYKPALKTVPEGGQGNSSIAAYSLVSGGTSTTGAFQAISPVATGQILVSGGTGALAAFSATPTVTSLSLGGATLNNFQESTYTPVLSLTTPGTSSFSYTTQVGRYTYFGTAVYFTLYVALSSFTLGTGSGNLVVTLPFTSANVTNSNFVCACTIENSTYGASVKWYDGLINNNTNKCSFQGYRASTTTLGLTGSNITNTTIIKVSGWYSTA